MYFPSPTSSQRDYDDSAHFLSTWSRIYLHGCLVLVVVFAVSYIAFQLAPFFAFTDNRWLGFLLALITIFVAPPVIGSVVVYGLLPLLGKHENLTGLDVWDDRLVAEITRAKQRTQIVVVNWPNKEIRTIGVLTSQFKNPESGQELATVYIPTAPQTRYGYIHVVPVEELELTDWTLKQWQLYQLSFGAARPVNAN